ncbi:MAG: alpha/beta hydrolase [Alphaproteobacteria bacterium]
MAVFREYDQAALDRQYNAREAVPDHPAVIARWDRAGAGVRDRFRGEIDLAYGDDRLETLDVFPAAGSRSPVLVFVHGGYWQWRDKADFLFLVPPWVEAGVTMVMVNYPLAPAAAIEEIVDSCRRAVAWVAARIGGMGGDPRRIWITGHSAGGHLTAAMVATDWRRYGFWQPPLAGGLAISGLYELEPIRLSYLNEVLSMDAPAAAACSPALHPPAEAPPLLAAVGGDETAEFHRQQRALVEAWRGAGLAIEEVPLPGRNHFTVLDALADPGHGLFRTLHSRLVG